MKRLLTILLVAAVANGCAIISIPLSLTRETKMREFSVRPAKGRLVTNKILLLDVSGVITAEPSSGLFSERPSMLADMRDALDMAAKDSRIKAIVLRVNSPGGEVTASDSIYEAIRRFKQERAQEKRPVVVVASLLGVGASGAYYISLAADKIYIAPTGITGSIGVIAMFPELAGLTRKIGVDVRVIKSADKKDIGSMWRDFTPEEQKILQQMVDELYNRFVDIVSRNRPGLSREQVRDLADGRIYTARQAREKGLVDDLLYLDDVIERAKSQAGISDAHVVTYRRLSDFQGGIYSRSSVAAPQPPPQVNLLQINADGLFAPWHQPGFYYLWMP